ncbi:MAG: hypothetical protein RJA07_1276 [Bacteroidota bacterium]|jgi:beta-mannosidase
MKEKLIFCAILFHAIISNAKTIEQSLNSDKVQWRFRCGACIADKRDIAGGGRDIDFGKRLMQGFAAKVPGTIHLDLLDNRLIADPFYADNEKRLQWIDTADWVYETKFDMDRNVYEQHNIELQLDGLDTYADVYLNDKKVVAADNMFVQWNEDVKDYLKLKGNRLTIVFHATLKEAKRLKASFEKQHGYSLPEGERVFVRKAQYQFGWDFAPRLLGCGIWKGVKLVAWSDFRINDIAFETRKIFASDSAIINLKLKIDFDQNKWHTHDATMKSDKTLPLFIIINNKSRTDTFQFNHSINDMDEDIEQEFKIYYPIIWSCNGTGNANFESVRLQIQTSCINTDASLRHINIDLKNIDLAIRSSELVEHIDSIGECFYFKLNGKPVFIKGANWVPADVFLPHVSHQKYRNLIMAAKDAGMNMLRVWGGGAYEDEYFYHLCDSMGIMIWQDMMFACALYPEDSLVTSNAITGKIEQYRLFPANAEDEIEQLKCRLLKHPSVVLLCGNNEIDEGLNNWGWQSSLHYSATDSANEAIKYYKMFADKTQGIKGDMFYDMDNYISTSPKYGWGHSQSLTHADSHYWGVWWGMEPYEMYNIRVPRFASEYGMQSLPCLATIRKFAPDSSLRINSVAMRNHQKHPTGYENLDGYLKYYHFNVYGGDVKGRKVIAEYGKGNPDEMDTITNAIKLASDDSIINPDRFSNPVRIGNNPVSIRQFEDYINATQQLQADALRTAIEAHLKAQPRCMGTILWQLNEPWPGASWSLIDYYGNKKKAYYEVQRLYKRQP